VRETFDYINLLVLEGDAAALAEHVSKVDAKRIARTETSSIAGRAGTETQGPGATGARTGP